MLWEKLSDCEKTDATLKTTLKDCKRRRATAAHKRLIAPEAEYADTKAGHTRLVEVSSRVEKHVVKTQTDLESFKVRFGEVEQASKLASASL